MDCNTQPVYVKSENAEAWTAWECLTRTRVNIFLTGRAGTGKTTFLRRLKQLGQRRMVVLAPTGVAAINAGGMTIHSFFQLSPELQLPGMADKPNQQRFNMRETKKRIIRSMDLLVIDEISMVRADLMDAIDQKLRQIRHRAVPFGGVQLLLIGDLHQLTPVVTQREEELLYQHYDSPFFFSSLALRQVPLYTIELKKIYRQNEPQFIELLNAVRTNTLTPQDLALLNSRYIPNFNPPDSENYIRLTTHNATTQNINSLRLSMLSGALRVYDSKVQGTFNEKDFPVDPHLGLKVGAMVMFMRNDPDKRFYNGKLGHVSRMTDDFVEVLCPNEAEPIRVAPITWDNVTYELNKETGEVETKVIGQFSQIPLALAWCITIHKSQGLTFDRAIIDAGNSFSAGQVYVALSRCRSLEGMVLSSPIPESAVRTDTTVQTYEADASHAMPNEQAIEDFAADFAVETVNDVLNVSGLLGAIATIAKFIKENYARYFGSTLVKFDAAINQLQFDVIPVMNRFAAQCFAARQTYGNITTDTALMSRIVNGAKWLDSKVVELVDPLPDWANISIDNKADSARLSTYRATLSELLTMKHAELHAVVEKGFSVPIVMEARALAVAKEEEKSAVNKVDKVKAKQASQRANVKQDDADNKHTDVSNPALYNALKRWRKAKADEIEKPAFVVMTNNTMMDIANFMPRNAKELVAIPGIGKSKLENYGADILAIVDKHRH